MRGGAVSRIVDLRWRRACDDQPSLFAADAFYRHVPMLDHLESRYRGAASYLEGSGVAAQTLRAARSRLLD